MDVLSKRFLFLPNRTLFEPVEWIQLTGEQGQCSNASECAASPARAFRINNRSTNCNHLDARNRGLVPWRGVVKLLSRQTLKSRLLAPSHTISFLGKHQVALTFLLDHLTLNFHSLLFACTNCIAFWNEAPITIIAPHL